jgi:phage-related holin
MIKLCNANAIPLVRYLCESQKLSIGFKHSHALYPQLVINLMQVIFTQLIDRNINLGILKRKEMILQYTFSHISQITL